MRLAVEKFDRTAINRWMVVLGSFLYLPTLQKERGGGIPKAPNRRNIFWVLNSKFHRRKYIIRIMLILKRKLKGGQCKYTRDGCVLMGRRGGGVRGVVPRGNLSTERMLQTTNAPRLSNEGWDIFFQIHYIGLHIGVDVGRGYPVPTPRKWVLARALAHFQEDFAILNYRPVKTLRSNHALDKLYYFCFNYHHFLYVIDFWYWSPTPLIFLHNSFKIINHLLSLTPFAQLFQVKVNLFL